MHYSWAWALGIEACFGAYANTAPGEFIHVCILSASTTVSLSRLPSTVPVLLRLQGLKTRPEVTPLQVMVPGPALY